MFTVTNYFGFTILLKISLFNEPKYMVEVATWVRVLHLRKYECIKHLTSLRTFRKW